MNAASFSIPKPLPPLVDRHEVGGVFLRPAYYFENFFLTVISASPMPDGDLERWSDISPVDVGFLHVSPLQLRHGFNGAMRNYALWHSRRESRHFQKKDRDESRMLGLLKKEQYTRYWSLPDVVHDYIAATHFGNMHLVGVDTSVIHLIRPGSVLKLSGHSLNWAAINDDGGIDAVDSNGQKFGMGNAECVLFLPETFEIIEPDLVRRITSARDVSRLSDKSFVTLIENRNDLLLLENKDFAPSISRLPCVVSDNACRSGIRLDHSIHRVVGRTRILMCSLFWLFQLSFSDRRMFVQMNRYESDGGCWDQLSWRGRIAFALLTTCHNAVNNNHDVAVNIAGSLVALVLFIEWSLVHSTRYLMRLARFQRAE